MFSAAAPADQPISRGGTFLFPVMQCFRVGQHDFVSCLSVPDRDSVGIIQLQLKSVSQIDSHKSGWNPARLHLRSTGPVPVGSTGRKALCRALTGGIQLMLGDRLKAVIGGSKNVRVLTHVYPLQLFKSLFQIVITMPHRTPSRSTIDCRLRAVYACFL